MEAKLKNSYKQLESLNNQRKRHYDDKLRIRQVLRRKQFQKQLRGN